MTQTLADVAAKSLAAVRVLEQHGLDYCCGGKRGFEEACAEKGLAPHEVLAAIEQAGGNAAAERDWQTEPLDELARHIVATHHEYLKAELPAIGQRLDKVLAVHGQKDPQALARLAEVFQELRSELAMHLRKEEEILFPYLTQYGRAERRGEAPPPVPFGSIAHPIQMMEHEHDGAGDALAEIRRLTGDFQTPEWACATVAALWDSLRALEADLHQHIHLENNILFVRAVALERTASPCRS